MAFERAIALTGGIAVGKSTVCSLLKLNGLRIIDADEISHRILDESHEWVKEHFGSEFVDGSKVLRSSLGKLIFADASKKRALEEYLHPKIKDAITKESIKQDKLGFAYIIDIPLFFETKNYDIKESVVVYAPKELQLARLMKRDGFSKEEALGRIESQMDIEKKKALATWVIDNSKDLAHLQDECERFVDLLKSR